MYKFSLTGNSGYYNPDSGKVKKDKCGICGSRMNIERDVRGPAGFAEAMAGSVSLHDRVFCPNLMERWHRKIVDMKMATYTYLNNPFFGHGGNGKKIRKKLKDEIKKIFRDLERRR